MVTHVLTLKTKQRHAVCLKVDDEEAILPRLGTYGPPPLHRAIRRWSGVCQASGRVAKTANGDGRDGQIRVSMGRCVVLVSGKPQSAWSSGFSSLRCHRPAPRPFIKDQTQVWSLSNLKATLSVSVTSPVHTQRGSPRITFIRLPGQIGPWHWTNGRWWCGMALMSSGLLLFPGRVRRRSSVVRGIK